VVKGTITRAGKPSINVEQPVTLLPGEQREVTFSPDRFDGLTVANPDLWWPYTLGKPDLYDLRLEFEEFGQVSDSSDLRFGIRTVSQHRDSDGDFPDLGKGGNFYLTSTDGTRPRRVTRLTFCSPDPDRETRSCAMSRIWSQHAAVGGQFPASIVEKADELGIPDVRLDVLQPVWQVVSVDDEDRQWPPTACSPRS
jgi:exo-1,4-beta-D-glucosaminidase